MKPQDKTDILLKAYESYQPRSTSFVEWLFKFILLVSISLFLTFGYYLTTIEAIPEEIAVKISRIKTQFLIQEKKPIKKVIKKQEKKIVPPKKEEKKEEPIDLTKKPELKQKEDDIKKEPVKKKKVRRIYGLKKVYSKGIGSGGTLSDAVIGKLGNTLKKDVDTITATKEEIIGDVVSVTTVTTSPVLKRIPKPDYSKEMMENAVEGKVKVKILVDIDGKVKKAIALNDIGYGTADLACKACLKAEFDPARRNGNPVAVWITFTVIFAMLG